MIYKYLTFSISITFISFIVGMMVNAVLKKNSIVHQFIIQSKFHTKPEIEYMDRCRHGEMDSEKYTV